MTTLLTWILKTSSLTAGTLLATSVNDSKVVGRSGRNDRKLAKSDFIKPICKAEESCFLTLDVRRAFT